jgi:tetratricopeptide (TPR) repeat protein
MNGEAARELESVLKTDPREAETYLLLAVAVQRRPFEDAARAEGLLRKALELEPASGTVHLHLAHALSKQQRNDEARAGFERALALAEDPVTRLSAHLGLMGLYRGLKDHDAAQAHYEAVCKIDPSVKDLLLDAEIADVTPPPQYPPGADKGSHPSWERRIQRSLEEIKKLPASRQQ